MGQYRCSYLYELSQIAFMRHNIREAYGKYENGEFHKINIPYLATQESTKLQVNEAI